MTTAPKQTQLVQEPARSPRRQSQSVANDVPAPVGSMGGMTPLSTTQMDVQKYGIRASGRKEFLAHLRGTRLTARARAKAMCYWCMSFFESGKEDCQLRECPLHPLQPYRGRGSVFEQESRACP